MDKLDWNFYDHRRQADDETREDVLARALKQVHLTLKRNCGQSVVWVAHGDVVIITTLWAKGMPLTMLNTYKGSTYIAHGSVTKFVCEPGRELPVSVEYLDPNKR